MKKTLRKAEPYFWILPSVILMSIFIIVPIGQVFRMAFSKVTKTGKVKELIGFGNFMDVIGSKEFVIVLQNTIVWTVVVVGLSTLLGFMLALLLNNEFKGRKIARVIVVFPWATTLVIQASAWKFIINTDYGALNTLLKTLGIINHNINWTPTPEAFFAWEIACGIFVTIPFVCFTTLSGLQSIDASLYEAATVDGANYWTRLTKILIPMMASSFTITTFLTLTNSFKQFDLNIYNTSITKNMWGDGQARAVIFFIVLVCISLVQVAINKRNEVEM